MAEYFKIVGQDRFVDAGTKLLSAALSAFACDKFRDEYRQKLSDPGRREAIALFGFAISPQFSSAFDFQSLEMRHLFLHRVAGQCQFIDHIGYLTSEQDIAQKIDAGVTNIREVIRTLGIQSQSKK